VTCDRLRPLVSHRAIYAELLTAVQNRAQTINAAYAGPRRRYQLGGNPVTDLRATTGSIRDAVLKASLDELGAETLDGSGFESETPDDLEAAEAEEVQP
jgi:hypothetical protein